MKNRHIFLRLAILIITVLTMNSCEKTESLSIQEKDLVGTTKSLTLNSISGWIINTTNGHLYRLIEPTSFIDAENQALELGGHLVTINNHSEELWLVGQFGIENDYWIGFNDRENEGNWEWISGEQSDYTNWCQDEPNNLDNEDAAVMNSGLCENNGWNDLIDWHHHWAIIEKVVNTASIDIKPGSDPNSINLKSKGNITVALLTNSKFDATNINPETVTMGDGIADDTPVELKKNGYLKFGYEDIDNDGDIDLIFHFSVQELIKNGDLQHSTTKLFLTGNTWQGDQIMGSDDIQIVGKPKSCADPSPCLIAWWPGDGNTNEIINGYSAELIGEATFDIGLVNEAFSLDGSDDFINIPHNEELNFSTNDFTLEFWIQFRTIEGEQIMVEKWIQKGMTSPGNPIGWSYTKIGNSLRFTFSNAELGEFPIDVTPENIPTNTWVHIAVTRSLYTFVLFWNGHPIRSETLTQTYNVDSDSSLKFGHRGNPEDTPGSDDDRGFYLNGLIDEVSIYNCALSSEEIFNIFTAGNSGKCKKGF